MLLHVAYYNGSRYGDFQLDRAESADWLTGQQDIRAHVRAVATQEQCRWVRVWMDDGYAYSTRYQYMCIDATEPEPGGTLAHQLQVLAEAYRVPEFTDAD